MNLRSSFSPLLLTPICTVSGPYVDPIIDTRNGNSSNTGPSTPKGASQSSAPLRRDAWGTGGLGNKGELLGRCRARGRATRHATKHAGNGQGARIQKMHFSRREPVCSERPGFSHSNVSNCEGKIVVLGLDPRKRASNHLSAWPCTTRGVGRGAAAPVVCMETRT